MARKRGGRPLESCRVGVSISGQPAELAKFGFDNDTMNAFLIRLCRRLFADGATLAFGHDWRVDGVMQTIADSAFEYHADIGGEEAPAILNVIPWPLTESSVDPDTLERLEGLVRVEAAGLPPEFAKEGEEVLARSGKIPVHLGAASMAQLRLKLMRQSDARLAVGGKLSGFMGAIPGIVEEVYRAVKRGQPVYLAGLMGGAARELGQVLFEGKDPSHLLDSFVEPKDPKSLLKQRIEDMKADLVSPEFRKQLIAGNGLDKKTNKKLLNSTLEEDVILLAIRGLRKAWKGSGK